MTKVRLFILVMVAVILTSCAVTKPILATENPIGSKIGRSKQTGILFFPPPMAEAGIHIAARRAGITKISTVDYTVRWYILVYELETTVTGE